MPPSTLASSSKPLSGRYLSLAEREEIALWRVQGHGVREIARRLGRAGSTISRELRRNAATRGGQLDYRASIAQWKAERQSHRPKTAKLASEERLRAYVQARLAGTIARTDGKQVPGPVVRFIGRRHGRRADRRWAASWSPEQIANRLKLDFPEDATMRISHEAIYQALFIQGRGALKRELIEVRRAASPTREVFNQLTNRDMTFVDPDEIVYFRDVYDHLIRLTDELDMYRELAPSTLDVYLTQVNNNLSVIMKRLTGVTVILAGIGAVAGIFGMSEANAAIGGGEAGGFWVVTGIVVLAAGAGMMLLRKIDWI